MIVEKEILEILENSTTQANSLFLPDQLDRKIYTKVNKIIEAAGGKWDRKTKSHVFQDSASDRVDEIVLTQSVLDPKKDLNFFPTPEEIITSMMNKVEFTSTSKALEPSFGDGRILKRMRNEPFSQLHGVEINKEMFENQVKEISEKNIHLIHGDFLSFQENDFDIILMNPPFKKKQGIAHTTHALELLNKNGTLVAILPSSVVYSKDKKTTAFQELLKEKKADVINLQSGTFKESGTMVSTVMIIVRQKN